MQRQSAEPSPMYAVPRTDHRQRAHRDHRKRRCTCPLNTPTQSSSACVKLEVFHGARVPLACPHPELAAGVLRGQSTSRGHVGGWHAGPCLDEQTARSLHLTPGAARRCTARSCSTPRARRSARASSRAARPPSSLVPSPSLPSCKPKVLSVSLGSRRCSLSLTQVD